MRWRALEQLIHCKPVRLRLFAESASYSVVFFSYSKLANNTFSYDFSAKRIGCSLRGGYLLAGAVDAC